MLEIKNVSFMYKKTNLFNDVSLNLEPGNIYGLLGKNGAGKTTLLKIMGGLLFPNQGKCIWESFNVSERDPRYLENLFFLPEEFYLPPVKGDLFVTLNAPFYPNFNISTFREYANEFNLDTEQKLNTLSFGQKKKFLLSFGLATNCSLIIMDEPTNGLDIPSKTVLRKIIAKSMTNDKTILISTHQVKDVENLIDPIIILESGNIIFNQSIFDISTNLVMESVPSLEGNEIFAQEVIGGYQVIRKNSDQQDEHVDLELLFNGVITDHKVVNSAFNGYKGGDNE